MITNEHIIKNQFQTEDYFICDLSNVYELTFYRKLISKIIQMSSLIATYGRIGPAKYFLIPTYYYNLIKNLISNNCIGNMMVIENGSLKNNIIVVRPVDDYSSEEFRLTINILDNKIDRCKKLNRILSEK